MNPYEALGVSKKASQSEIKRAYRAKATKAHPDRNGGNHEAMSAINRAYQAIGDETARAKFDQTGETGNIKPTREMMAVNLLGMIVQQWLGQEAPFIAFVRMQLAGHTNKVIGDVSGCKLAVGKCERALKALKKKRAGKDALTQILDAQVRGIREKLAMLEEQAAIAKLALEMLDEYEGDASPAAARYSSAHTIFSVGM